jgi:hypothetical protein
MYADFKDKAAFLLVYVREAHPSDCNWPDKDAQVKEPTKMDERIEAAKLCVEKLKFTIPVAIDGMDDAVGLAYTAWPERIYIVGTDGKIAYRTGLGPFGFKPKDARAALEKLLEK